MYLKYSLDKYIFSWECLVDWAQKEKYQRKHIYVVLHTIR